MVIDKEKLMQLDRICSKSKLTEEDALEIGDQINKSIARKHSLMPQKNNR